jgi:hypothetical protein
MRQARSAAWCAVAAGLLSAPGAAAQAVSITTVDSVAGAALSGVSVTVTDSAGSEATGITDAAGRASLTLPRPGHYYIEGRRVGFRVRGLGPIEVAADRPTDVVLAFDRTPLSLPEITTTAVPVAAYLARVGFDERSRSGLGYFLAPEEVAQRARGARHVTDLLATIPGVSLIASAAGRMGTLPRVSGVLSPSRPCTTPRILVDGVVIVPDHVEDWSERRPGDADAVRDAIGQLEQAIHPGDVLAIEVYRRSSEVPSRYGGTQAACGVVLIWSKRGVAG